MKVVESYRAMYLNPIRFRSGEILHVEDRPSEWEGWIWGTSRDQLSGWVPKSLLRREGNTGLALEDYDARELTVECGEDVTVLKEENGWLWCRRANALEGWIPKTCVAEDPPVT